MISCLPTFRKGLALSLLPATVLAESASVTAKLDSAQHKVRVEIGGSLFTELIYGGLAKPVLFPVIGPGGVTMTRQWPLGEALPGEEKDHPHHKGLWFTHGAVNGVDFWSEKPGAGKIVVQGQPEITGDATSVTLKTTEEWQTPEGKPVLTSTTGIVCGLEGGDRYIDYSITLTASSGKVVFGDTKEGTMGLRVNPALNLKGEVARGKAVTSEGKTGAAAWGTKARWVDYWAPTGEGNTGVACFDHPSNLRHPTTWHARDYGLIAANPFGLHDFLKMPAGAGDYTLEDGKTLTLRYRWLFHGGDTETARIGARWKQWTEGN